MLVKEISPDKAVGAAHGAGQHVGTPDVEPVFVDGLHFGECGVVGQHRDILPLVDAYVAVVELDNRRTPLAVGDGPVQGCDGTPVEGGAGDVEVLALEHGHDLGGGGAQVEHPCREHGQRHGRTPVGRGIVIDCALAEEAVDHKPLLVHSLGDTSVIAHGIDGAIARGPLDCARQRVPFLGHPCGIDI